ncbi:MAG: hypothetical protein IKE35_03345 [Lachnospiraceae bacterium]|nr:hypothetical protein [Lachnospiraceae bacterium]
MKKLTLSQLIFAAICCDLGLFAKKLIGPAANIVTESLHSPGGIATSFSLMFLVVAAAVLKCHGCATVMAVVQSILAFAFGMTGSMGALAPIGYIIPGIVIDVCLFISQKISREAFSGIMPASVASSVSAALVANLLVFRLAGIILAVYVLVAATSGAICSAVASILVKRLIPVLYPHTAKEQKAT